jgi:hypothetical protein
LQPEIANDLSTSGTTQKTCENLWDLWLIPVSLRS